MHCLPAELRLSTLSMATFARRLKARLFVSTEWVPAARLILLKAALLINIMIMIFIIIMIIIIIILVSTIVIGF